MLRDGTEYVGGGAGQRLGALVALPAAEHAPRLFWSAPHPFDPKAETAGSPVVVYANAGRWLVDCPDCNSALLAPRDDPRFMCCECGNAKNDRKFRPVVWPAQEADIEALLGVRPVPNQNWLPVETLDDLRRQNAAHGLAVL